MKTALRVALVAAVLIGVLAALALGAALLTGLFELADSGAVITIDGERMDLDAIHPGHLMLAMAAIVVAAFVVVAVVPVVLIAGVALPLALTGVVLACAVALLALLFSPLILLVWWLWRKSRPAATIRA